MIKDIKYNGYTAQPSDYECSDGQLATSLNLISEDSQLKPLLQPIPTSIGLSASQKAVNLWRYGLNTNCPTLFLRG